MDFNPRNDGLRNSDIREWTRRIQEAKAVNLAQGLCHTEPTPQKIRAVRAARHAMLEGLRVIGFNTYSHYSGEPALRNLIARKALEYNNLRINPDTDVIVTCGASGAFECAVEALMQPGDEAIVFEPVYTYHTSLLRKKGVVIRPVRLRPPGWTFDVSELERAVTAKTKMIVLNTPNNPTGKVFLRSELESIAALCRRHPQISVVTDEVYEFMVFDGHQHVSFASLPGMWERTITMNSFSKPLGITGWRVGYAIAPEIAIKVMGFTNEYEYVCAPTPLQHGVLAAFEEWTPLHDQGRAFARKRDMLCDALSSAGLPHNRPQGSMYVLVDVGALGGADAVAINSRLIANPGVGGVPAQGFYSDETGKHQIRFCYGVMDSVLQVAAERLALLRGEMGG